MRQGDANPSPSNDRDERDDIHRLQSLRSECSQRRRRLSSLWYVATHGRMPALRSDDRLLTGS